MKPLDPQGVASFIFLSMTLILWIGAWRGERRWLKSFREWEAQRRARRLAEEAANGGPAASPSDAPRKGPWG